MTQNDLIFFNQRDPFEDADDGKAPSQDLVHIRIQQRTSRKSITTVQGLPPTLDLKGITKRMKRAFSTNGTVVTDRDAGPVIQLQGDQRQNCHTFLTSHQYCHKSAVKVHGF